MVFRMTSSVRENPAKTPTMMVAAATTTRPPVGEPVDDGLVRRSAVDVGLSDPGHEEDLVVHRQPEQNAGEQDGQEEQHR